MKTLIERHDPDATQTSPKAEGLRVVQTAPTLWSPAGFVVDDSLRGSVFWQVHQPVEKVSDDGSVLDSSTAHKTVSSHEQQKRFGIQWLSTSRMSFYQSRHLRNAWNSNKPIKVARDGTEVDTSTGARLLDLFQLPTPK